jgi:hypothetical protein
MADPLCAHAMYGERKVLAKMRLPQLAASSFSLVPFEFSGDLFRNRQTLS